MDQDNQQTSLLLYNFLQCSSNSLFLTELNELGSELTKEISQDFHLEGSFELQTDGNGISHQGLYNQESDSERQEEIIRAIAMQLAHVGDQLENSIQPSLVNDLVQQFRNVNLPDEDKMRCLAATLNQVMQMQTISLDIGQEKTTLLLTMLLAKKVITHAPSLLRSIFHITVDYINQNLPTYIRNLTRNMN